MRVLFFVFFLLSSLTASAADYIDALVEQDYIEVNCSNILEVVHSYVEFK